MLSRRSLLGRCLSALGLAAVAPVAKLAALLPDDPRATFTPSGSATAPLSFDGPPPPPSEPSGSVASSPNAGVRCFAVLHDTFDFKTGRAEPEHVAYCLDGETSVREWQRARHGGTWVSFMDALAAWGRA